MERATCRSGIRCPNTVTLPPVGRPNPNSRRISVVLPEPFGPIRPNVSPVVTAKDTPSSASTEPKRLLTLVSTTGSVVADVAIAQPPLSCSINQVIGQKKRNALVRPARGSAPG